MVSVLYQAALRVWGGRSDLFSQTMSCYTTQTRMIATRLGWMQKEKSRFWSQIKCKQATNGCDVHKLFFDTDTEIRGGCHHQQTEETNHTLFHAVTLSSTVPPVWPPCAWTVRGTVTFTSYCTVSIPEDYFLSLFLNKCLLNPQAWEISDAVQSHVRDELHNQQRGGAAL